jgi:cation diffusion facilitator family transporter
VLAALGANLGIAATKFIAFAITGSASMLAEAVHSVADSGNQVLLLLGRNRARRARTEEHPFGYGRERYFYAFVVAVVLFTVGCLFSVYEGIQKITHPEPVRDPVVAFVVLGIAVAAESFSLRTALQESSAQRDGHGWLAFIRRAKAPELPAILLEDMAALTGLFLAAVGVALAVITGQEFWDGVGSLAIGALLACVAVILAVETKSLLIGESASTDVERAIVAALEDGTEVERVIHLRTLHMGPDSLLVAAKIAVRPYDRAETVAAGIDAAERRVRAAVPIARMIYLEPDLYRAGRADATDPSIRAVRRPRRLPAARPRRGGMFEPEYPVRTQRLLLRPYAPGDVDIAGRRAGLPGRRLDRPVARGWPGWLPGKGAIRGRRAARREAQQAQRPFLFEVQRLGGWRADPPDPAAELGDLGPYPRFRQHPQAERQRRGADVVAPLDPQRVRHRRQVVVAEPAVRAGRARGSPARGRRGLTHRGEQAEHVAVPEHPGGRTESLCRLRDAHDVKSNIFVSRTARAACDAARSCPTVELSRGAHRARGALPSS